LYEGWRGYLVSYFALIGVANIYMSLFFLIRTGIKKEGIGIKKDEKELEDLLSRGFILKIACKLRN